ncbi:Hypothetical predicted protein [Pelobates cultripes]|uniref:Uncharacterized protein n=1 Tax=Pelobates cultripes TaxID=61616 RepID=A0AAD1S4P6_PELCU|nr:Hypothetical predicted protein [Pelobates cultripes]
MAGAMCTEGRGKNCSLSALTISSATPGHKLEGLAAFLPRNANRRKNSHPSPQQSKPATSCEGDPIKLMTAAAQRGRNTAQRPYPPGTIDPAANRGTPATGGDPFITLHPSCIATAPKIQRGSQWQVLLDKI